MNGNMNVKSYFVLSSHVLQSLTKISYAILILFACYIAPSPPAFYFHNKEIIMAFDEKSESQS